MPIQDVVLYMRPGCHLCHEAEQVLIGHGLRPRLIDIDAEPELRARFDTSVPVVEIDGQIRFRGPIDEVLLRRLINAENAP